MSLAYSHDAAGRITRKSGNQDDWQYHYDLAERLVQASGINDQHAYQYDELGNRMETGGVYDAANRLQEDIAYTYTFDARGNLTQKVDKATGERQVYAYNGDNRLIRFERYLSGSTSPETTATYAYDPFGRRIRKTVNGQSTSFLWDGASLIAEYDASGNVIKRYHYAIGYAPMQVEDAHGAYQVHADHLDTPWYLTDASQQIVWQANYAPYGEAVADEDPDGNAQAVTFNVRFPGQYFDQETGLHYNYFRDYEPSTGRYVQSDPIGLDGGLNTYAYVGGNPISLTDPLGLAPPKPLPPERQRRRECNTAEYSACQQMCGSKGVQSCKVNQTFSVQGIKNGLPYYGWKDGPMSCSCNDPEGFCGRNPKTCAAGIAAGVCILLATPIPDDVLIPALIGAGAASQ